MHVAEIWRYPVKSLAGESLREAAITEFGIERDRELVILDEGRIVNAKSYPALLSLRATVTGGTVHIRDMPWNSPEVESLIASAIIPDVHAGDAAEASPVRLVRKEGAARFGRLPLSIATDGAMARVGIEGQRLRPNIVVGGVGAFEEREWPGHQIRLGEVIVKAESLRRRCALSNYDPETQAADPAVLQRIVREFEGFMTLDCSVVTPGTVRVGDAVEIL
jgi:uncharacterized protein